MESKIHKLEKEAYRSVLAAFKAQSDALTWDKEGLLTELRKELKVSSDKHKELLARVNSDELISSIRECRQRVRVGQIDPINSVQDSLSYQQISMSFDVPSRIHSQSFTTEQSRGLGNCGWPKLQHRNGGENCQVQDPLIGRRLMMRLPEDHTFYEVVIRDYRSDKGLYGLVHDEGTSKETWEWVDLNEISPDDIRWISKDPPIDISTLDHKKESRPSTKNVFKILHSKSLIQEAEKVCSSSPPNQFLLENAKKKLKTHEQPLINAIGKVAYTSDNESSNNYVHR